MPKFLQNNVNDQVTRLQEKDFKEEKREQFMAQVLLIINLFFGSSSFVVLLLRQRGIWVQDCGRDSGMSNTNQFNLRKNLEI